MKVKATGILNMVITDRSCHERMLKIGWKDRITNTEVLKRMHVDLPLGGT